MALPSNTLVRVAVAAAAEEDALDLLTICAFCLRTSAGVRIKHETSSPVDEAREWVMGTGRGVWSERRDLLPS